MTSGKKAWHDGICDYDFSGVLVKIDPKETKRNH